MSTLWSFIFNDTSLPVLTAVVSIGLLYLYVKNLGDGQHIYIRDASKSHSWSTSHPYIKSSSCSICSSLLLINKGAVCDCCGVCADFGCMKKADKKLSCKSISSKGPLYHHWIKGNLTTGATCAICDEECGCGPGLVDWKCCWCQREVHTHCKDKLNEICDCGKFKDFIIPPTSVTLIKQGRLLKNFRLKTIVPSSSPNWTPLFLLGNRKSGNNEGGIVLSLFRQLLNPAQVVDLEEQPPEVALEWCTLLDKIGIQAKVLVAGGDGTVGWVLNAIQQLKFNLCPAVAILPLGTGNDLSRVLGWGKEQVIPFNPSTILEYLQAANTSNLDRWQVDFNPLTRHLGMKPHSQSKFMYNYLSIGVDAQVTLDFHRTRQSRYYVCSSRFFNKILYLCFGTQQAVERECRDLEQRLEVYLDGHKANLPSIESIVVLNIPSWGAGVMLWKMGVEDDDSGNVPDDSYSDGKLEVCAIYSSFHIAQLQVGLSQPHRIGQASHVKIKLKSPVAVQIDGEPWIQQPAEINVKFQNQASVLTWSEPM